MTKPNLLLARFSRSLIRRPAIVALYVALFAVSAVTAFGLRFDFHLNPLAMTQLLYATVVWLAVKTVICYCCGLDRSAWRFLSSWDALMLVVANLAGSAVSAPIIAMGAPKGFPRSIYVLDFVVSLLLTGGTRVSAKVLLELLAGKPDAKSPKALIYGAGAAGVRLLRASRTSPGIGYDVCGFVDDDRSKTGMLIYGVPVRGAGEDLRRLAPKHGVRTVLIAAPSASKQQMLTILKNCADAEVRFFTIPGISELVPSGNKPQLRDVALEDLLGRPAVHLEEDRVRGRIQDRAILVTGAAGSIGSELCRQIACFAPKIIVGFDIAETGLFHIDREMRVRFPDVLFKPVVGSVQNPAALASVFEEYRPATVYHAAAYKHVPMMERHIFEAVENNVLGTFLVAKAAERAGVREFVMISSDKAVRPTNVMGLTKRAAEILLSSLHSTSTKFVSVRFGNVLGSNGSAVPIFREQIAAGGPVTLTHPEMRRYFMTIPEASQLVLQAFAMGEGGEIFVLDMGEPVKIVDLARNLILLSGLRPDEDIRLEFTGIRPGEKLYEELNTADERTLPTYHEKIFIFAGKAPVIQDLGVWINTIRKFCAARDTEVLAHLKDLVPEYNPSADIMRSICRQHVGSDNHAAAVRAAS
jgi:FlaA1/EpsC-like NDP-sugar epimerase